MKAVTASLCHLSGLTILLIKCLFLTILCFIFNFANKGLRFYFKPVSLCFVVLGQSHGPGCLNKRLCLFQELRWSERVVTLSSLVLYPKC